MVRPRRPALYGLPALRTYDYEESVVTFISSGGFCAGDSRINKGAD